MEPLASVILIWICPNLSEDLSCQEKTPTLTCPDDQKKQKFKAKS